MYHYVQNPLYQQPAVSSGSHLRRYERTPPHVQASLSITLSERPNGVQSREDITLVLRQQPKEALVTTDGKEKGEVPLTTTKGSPFPCTNE